MSHSISFLSHFSALPDPRQETKVLYRLDEMLLLCLCGVISGAESFAGVVDYGRQKLDFLRTLLPFSNGIPSHDALNDVFRALDAQAFEECFLAWARDMSACLPGLVAIDGKTARASRDGNAAPLHMVSAWACEQKLVLGQMPTHNKSNEITAIPALLDMLVLQGAIVSIDAMGAQKEIAAAVKARDADYVMALKGNQGALHDDVVTFFDSDDGHALPVVETVDTGHGRIETRRYRMSGDIDWLRQRHPDWPGMTSIAMVETWTEKPHQNTPPRCERRFYITSLAPDAERLATCVRGHWGIENSLHWVMDVTFDEDRCRVRKDMAARNFALLRRCALNLINHNKGKSSVASIRRRAGWGDHTMKNLLYAS